MTKLTTRLIDNKAEVYWCILVFVLIPVVVALFNILGVFLAIGLLLSFVSQAVVLLLYIRNS